MLYFVAGVVVDDRYLFERDVTLDTLFVVLVIALLIIWIKNNFHPG